MEMLTIFLRHDQAKTLDEINNHLKSTGWRDLNALVEREAWGGYRTEFYPTYDYRALYKQEQSKNP